MGKNIINYERYIITSDTRLLGFSFFHWFHFDWMKKIQKYLVVKATLTKSKVLSARKAWKIEPTSYSYVMSITNVNLALGYFCRQITTIWKASFQYTSYVIWFVGIITQSLPSPCSAQWHLQPFFLVNCYKFVDPFLCRGFE